MKRNQALVLMTAAFAAGVLGPLSLVDARLAGPLHPEDSELLETVREKYLVPPSDEHYNLKGDHQAHFNLYKRTFPSWMMIDSILKNLFGGSTDGHRRRGFFIEAGALDGELLSNTLWLERKLHWTGLLVEPDPRLFGNLLKTRRKAWAAPVCLAARGHPYVEVFKMWNDDGGVDDEMKGGTAVKKDVEEDISAYESYASIQCLPVQTLLLALNVTHVDFFSLDTEGGEMDTLRNFPFDKITVDVLAIEHVARDKWRAVEGRLRYEEVTVPLALMRLNSTVPAQKIEDTRAVIELIEDIDLVSFMQDKGYYLFDILCYVIPDLIFIRKNSSLFERLKVPTSQWDRRSVCGNKPLRVSEVYTKKISMSDFRDHHHYPNIEYKELSLS